MTSSSSPSQDTKRFARSHAEGLRADALMEGTSPSTSRSTESGTATSSTAPSARPCAVSPASPPSSRTSPRSSTGSSAWSASCSSGCGPRAPCRTPRTPSRSSPPSPRRRAPYVLDGVIQRRDKPDAATYIGSGKAEELRDIVLESGADTVICDGELSPGQLHFRLEDVVEYKVIDQCPALILDIFAEHAKSRRARRRSRSRRCSTCCRGCAAGVSRCPGRWAAARAAASPPVVPVRPRSRRTGGGCPREDGEDAPGDRGDEDRPRDQAPGAQAQQGAVRRHRGLHQRG
ncbi:GTPase HflX [Streptomyces tanashiensis]